MFQKHGIIALDFFHANREIQRLVKCDKVQGADLFWVTKQIRSLHFAQQMINIFGDKTWAWKAFAQEIFEGEENCHYQGEFWKQECHRY